jgi:hypothetical protein
MLTLATIDCCGALEVGDNGLLAMTHKDKTEYLL